MASSIEWLGGGNTWNPLRARIKEIYTGTVMNPLPIPVPAGKVGWMCVKVSPGCQECYAEKQNVTCGTNPGRNGTGFKYAADKLPLVEIYLDEKTLLAPLHWKKGKLIFPCSMTDWMADFVPDEFRDKMLAVMALTPQHTYLTLTKRADRQRKYMTHWPDGAGRYHHVFSACHKILLGNKKGWSSNDPEYLRARAAVNQERWPLPNLWLGTSAEDQQRANERIPEILRTPAALRWLSIEPQLEAINLDRGLQIAWQCSYCQNYFSGGLQRYCTSCGKEGGWSGSHIFNPPERQVGSGINWVVVGGESGPGARPFNIEWARQIVSQCQRARVPVFVKQLGSKPFLHKQESVNIDKPGFKFSMQSLEINSTFKLKDRKGGDMQEWPTDLQVRQYPEVAR